MNAEIIADCMAASFADTPFPAVVQRLASAGVKAYQADLIALRKTYYDGGASALDEPMPLAQAPQAAEAFDASAVERCVRAIQRRELGYAEFLRGLMRAGCVRYGVFFEGRKVIYFGRQGECLTEPFPLAPAAEGGPRS
jgi:uncharacterized protein YbcV (DUF1398 family)